MIVDPHAHVMPERFVEDARKKRFGDAVTIESDSSWELLVTRTTVLGQDRVHRNPIPPEMCDVELRLEGMKRQAVDMQILSIAPPMTYYALDAGLNIELSATLNDALLDLHRANPARFACMAQIPLQAPEAAAKELERAVGMGHVGAQIGSNVAGKNLDDRELDVVWAKATELDVPLLIHPVDVMGINDRLKDYYLRNLIGNPMDTTIAAASLIFGGVFDRFPTIKFFLAHTGGFTPWARGRLQHGYRVRREPKTAITQAPDRWFDQFYYDVIIHDADALEFAVKTIGADRILYGSDFPFDMGYLGKADEIPGLDRLSPGDQNKILSENVRRLYKVDR